MENKVHETTNTEASPITPMESSSSPLDSNDSDDDYAEFGYPGEPEKGLHALGILLASMVYQKIDRATRSKIQKIYKANVERAKAVEETKRANMARDATMRRSLQQMNQKFRKAETSNNSKKKHKPSEDDNGGKLCMQRFKKPMLGYGVDDAKLFDFPPVDKLKDVVGQCSIPFEKVLTSSDLSSNLARLALVKGHTQEAILPLLNEEEIAALSRGMEINVTTFDGEGKEYNMVFKDWKQEKFYVLTKGWIPFLNQHSLVACEDWMTVWAFRHKDTGKLCFVLMVRRFPVATYYNAK